MPLSNEREVSVSDYSIPLDATLVGEVVYGTQQARKLGCPTANLVSNLSLASGIYGGYVDVPSLNIINTAALIYIKEGVLEAHLIDRDLDLYGRQLVVRVKDFVRPPVPYENAMQMTRLIQDDLKALRVMLT